MHSVRVGLVGGGYGRNTKFTEAGDQSSAAGRDTSIIAHKNEEEMAGTGRQTTGCGRENERRERREEEEEEEQRDA